MFAVQRRKFQRTKMLVGWLGTNERVPETIRTNLAGNSWTRFVLRFIFRVWTDKKLNVFNKNKSLVNGFCGRYEALLSPSSFCFGFNGYSSGCNGDSGSPLVCRGKDDKFFIAGVASWASRNCAPRKVQNMKLIITGSGPLFWQLYDIINILYIWFEILNRLARQPGSRR